MHLPVLLPLLGAPAAAGAGAGAPGEGGAQPMEVDQEAAGAAASPAAEQVLRPLPALHTVHVSWPYRDLASWLGWLAEEAAGAADAQQLLQLASPAALALVQALFEAVCAGAGDRLDSEVLCMMAGQAYGRADVLDAVASVLAAVDMPPHAPTCPRWCWAGCLRSWR